MVADLVMHRRHKLLDADGQPMRTQDIDIRSLPLIERAAIPGLPAHLEARLFGEPGLEPALVLFHPKAEVYRLVRLTTLPHSLPENYDAINTAVLKQAMGEPPDHPEGYKITTNEGTEP